MAMMMFEPMPYEGTVVFEWIAAAKQNSAFLSGSMEPFSRGMFKADLKATAKFAEQNVNGAVAAQIREEARRFFNDDVNTW